MTGWFFLSCMIVVSAWMKASGVFTSAWASASGRSEYDGNEHFSSIFLDEGGSAGLHPLEDCHCFVLTKASFPLLNGSLR